VKQVYGYNLTDVKLHNRFLVYNTIRLHGPIRRASVARKTRLTRATITNIINEFIEEGLVTSSQQGDSSHGYLQINPHAFKICAVHLQGAIAKVAVLTPDMSFGKTTRYRWMVPPKRPWLESLPRLTPLRKSMISR